MYKILLLSLFLISCASYNSKVAQSHAQIENGELSKALPNLKKLAETVNDDQLVYLLDYAYALSLTPDLKLSSQYFLKAEDLSDLQDYHSISKITGSLLLSEAMVQYKGDDYEKLLINVFLAINFAVNSDFDAAMVEVRKLNNKLTKFKIDGKKIYPQNAFMYYLSAVLWEREKNYDSAYIDYEAAYNLSPSFSGLEEDLVRASFLARRSDTHQKWLKKFPHIKFENIKNKNQKTGELVVIYQQGKGPQKVPQAREPRLPELRARTSLGQNAEVLVNHESLAKTERIYDLQTNAIKTFNDQYGELLAKRLAALVAKEVAAHQVRQRDEGLGALVWIAMHASDQADTRHWGLLPESIGIRRLRLPPGKHTVQLYSLDANNIATGEKSEAMEVEIEEGKSKFISWRSFK